jgi:hypothetical protein
LAQRTKLVETSAHRAIFLTPTSIERINEWIERK